jgi:hypothetical protein
MRRRIFTVHQGGGDRYPRIDDDPAWWENLLITLIDKNGGSNPLLWPLAWIVQILRAISIQNALDALRGEIGFDGSPDFNFVEAFFTAEKVRRQDPEFRRACESALRIGRIHIPFLGPTILKREIEGMGASVFIRRYGPRIGRTKNQIVLSRRSS